MVEIPYPVFWLLILNKKVSNFNFFIFKISFDFLHYTFLFWVLLVWGILFAWLVELVAWLVFLRPLYFSNQKLFKKEKTKALEKGGSVGKTQKFRKKKVILDNEEGE